MRKVFAIALLLLVVAAAGCIGSGKQGTSTQSSGAVSAGATASTAAGAEVSTPGGAEFSKITWPATYTWKTAVFSVAGNVPFEMYYTYVNAGGGSIVSKGVYDSTTATRTITGVTYFYVGTGTDFGGGTYVIHAWLPTAPAGHGQVMVVATATLSNDTLVGSYTNNAGVTTYFTIAGIGRYGR